MGTITEFPVELEYKNNTSIKKEEIQKIMDWILSQPHLPSDYISELDVILAYHACQQNSEVTKQVVDLNFTLRTLCSFYQKRGVNKSIAMAFNTWLITMLKTPTVDGYKVIYCHLLDPNPKNFVYADAVRTFTMVIDLWQYEEGTYPGVVVILNLDGMTFGHLSRVDLIVAQQFLYFLQEAMLVRLKEFHFTNAPSFMDKIMNMLKPFMKKELLDMIKIHQKGSEKIFETLKKGAFPLEAGGSTGTCLELKDEIWNKICLNQSFFDLDIKKVVNENQRPGKQKSINSFFGGMEGTFKKLEID